MAKKRRNSKSSSSKASPKSDEDDEKDKSQDHKSPSEPPPVIVVPRPTYDYYSHRNYSSEEDSDYEDIYPTTMLPQDIQLMILGESVAQVTIHHDSDDDSDTLKCDIIQSIFKKENSPVKSPVKEDPPHEDIQKNECLSECEPQKEQECVVVPDASVKMEIEEVFSEEPLVEEVKTEVKEVTNKKTTKKKNLKTPKVSPESCSNAPKDLSKPKSTIKASKSETKPKKTKDTGFKAHKRTKSIDCEKPKIDKPKINHKKSESYLDHEKEVESTKKVQDNLIPLPITSIPSEKIVCDVCKSAKTSSHCSNCQSYLDIQNGDITFKEAVVSCIKISTDNFNDLIGKTSQGGDVPEKVEVKEMNLVRDEFRSRSGSTDTSVSESGSNSSGSKRRSSRFKTKDTSPSEPPVPKEVTPVIAPPPTVNSSLLNYNLDRPVKVKSRWRRTSELEMGGAAQSTDAESTLSTASVTLTETQVDVQEESSEKLDPELECRLKSFEPIQQNEYLTQRSKSKEAKRMVCDCTLSKEEISRGELGCGEDCLNRLLLLECGSRCSLGSLCSNRRFQNYEYANCEVISTLKKGLGLIAKDDISGGQFIMEYVGEVLDPKEFRKRAKEYAKEKNRHYYFMALKSDAIIDATIKGNISRFINHSCDPNAETQKWTVNGELRIGFFSKRPIQKGEEITFDYQFQRYGKEAQKCHCESVLCRGWIGEEPEKEKEKKDWNKKEKKEKKRKEEKRRDLRDFLSDMDLEEEIEKLSLTGLKNKAHTLTLCRLMVRAEDERSRSKLLDIAQEGDARCLRLFLDYHGLSLIWSWMVDSCSPNKLKLQILETLSVLPITNKTILQDSKVLSVVQRWSDSQLLSLDRRERGSTEEEDKSPNENEDVKMDEEDSKAHEDTKLLEDNEKVNVKEKAEALLLIWSNLKEEFRIPKKERIEQMKEHEREADQGYVDPRELQSYDRHWSHEKDVSRFRERDSKEKKKGKESPDGFKISRPEERAGQTSSAPKMSKAQRRQLFALKVEEEERQKKEAEEREQKIAEELWQKHREQCSALGLDPDTTPLFNAPNGFPSFYHPVTSSLQPFPPPPDGVVSQPVLMEPCDVYAPPPSVPSAAPPSGPMFTGPPPRVPLSALPPPNFPPPLHPPPDLLTPPPPIQPQHFISPPPFVENSAPLVPSYPPPPLPSEAPPQVFPDSTLPPAQGFNYPPPIPLQFPPPAQSQPPQVTPEQEMAAQLVTSLCSAPPPPPPLPQMVKLPPKWKTAKDPEGRLYYYHRKTRKSQWQIPFCDPNQPPESSSESSDSSEEDESTTDDEDDDEREEDEVEEPEEEEIPFLKEAIIDEVLEPFTETKRPFETIPVDEQLSEPILKKKREGLIQVAIISPRDDSYYSRKGIKKSKIKENKEKFRHKKKRSHETSAKCEADTSSGPKRRIKDAFRMNMANVIVAILNPYRKPDCKAGRITNTEDFKHLARKLTHFVMTKELRQLSSVEELKVNDSVKHKAKDFVRKYMNRFGPVYHRSPNE